MRTDIGFRCSALFLLLAVAVAQAFSQAPITSPLFNVLDFSGDTGAVPLVDVQGGQQASTQGIAVTSQSTNMTTTNLPNFTTIMGTGFGGMSLVQTSPADTTTGVGQNSPFFCISGNQDNAPSTTSLAAVWCLHVQGGTVAPTSSVPVPDVIEWTRPTEVRPMGTRPTTLPCSGRWRSI